MAKWDLVQIEKAFVEAALDPSRWNAAMETATAATGARGAALFSIRGEIPLMPHSESLSEGLSIYTRDGWVERDERYKAAPALLRKGAASEFDFTTPEKMDRHPYYQEFLAPQNLRWFGTSLISAAEDQWSLSLQRSASQGPFQRAELEQLAMLSPRLSSVAALARAAGFSALSAAAEAFEFSGTAIVQINAAAQVIKLNKQAEELLGSGVHVVGKRLAAERPEATHALDHELHALLWNINGAVVAPPVPLPRAGRLPLLAYPLSLSAIIDNPFSHCRALVILIDPDRKNRPPDALLRGAFNLTAAEARLATRLATGETLEHASDELGIVKETARNQLKSVFWKMAVHRQSELVAMLARLPALSRKANES
jgi:DNA-binding CsgD family transcriptional regulator/PAS domain-containing protein